jgi:micrococcal nuclease
MPKLFERTGLVTRAGLVSVAVLVAGCAADPRPVGQPGRATVVKVIDGDTIVVELGHRRETVRLIGIDTPEVHHHDEPGECFGNEASARAGDLMEAGSTILLTRDVESRDRYGRLLAYVSVDELMVNIELVKGGYARVMTIPPNDALSAPLARAEAEARSQARGLWASCQ